MYVFIYTPSFQFALCLWVNIYLFMMSPFGRVGFFRHASIGRVYPAQSFSTECVWSASFFLDFNYSELLPQCPELWTLTFPLWPQPLSPHQHHASTIEGSKPRKPKLCQELIKYTSLTEHTAYGASLKRVFFQPWYCHMLRKTLLVDLLRCQLTAARQPAVQAASGIYGDYKYESKSFR